MFRLEDFEQQGKAQLLGNAIRIYGYNAVLNLANVANVLSSHIVSGIAFFTVSGFINHKRGGSAV